VADADPSRVLADSSVAADPSDLEVSRVFHVGEAAWEGSVGRPVGGCRCPLSQAFVGPVVVVLLPERVEPDLLLVVVCGGRPGGLGLQGPMHPLVTAVLLRMGGLDQLGEDPEPDPPDGEPRETPDGGGREGSSVVGADPSGQTVLAEEALEDGLGELVSRREEPADVEQVPGESVRDGEGIALDAVSGLEVALVVGGPDVVGRGDGRDGAPRVVESPPLPSRGHKAVALEDVADGGARR